MPGFGPKVITLAANGSTGDRKVIDARGTTVFMAETTEIIEVTLRSAQIGQGRGGESYTLQMFTADQWLSADEFDSLEFYNLGDAEVTITVYIGYGQFYRPVPDVVNVQVTSKPTATVVTAADETAINVGAAGKVALLAQDDNRVQAYITALSTNSDIIRIGDSNVDSDQGTPLQAGETMVWSSKAACYACAEATAGQSAAVTVFKE